MVGSQDGSAVGVLTRDDRGDEHEFLAGREVIVCCGAIDSPKLLQLSGIGPADVLDAAGVLTLVSLPGVGENLMDHAEGLIVWEAGADVPDTCATGWDGGGRRPYRRFRDGMGRRCRRAPLRRQPFATRRAHALSRRSRRRPRHRTRRRDA